MNERIGKLAVEADKLIQNQYLVRQQSEWCEKFAELIVAECMACSTWVGKMNTNSVEPVHTAHAINQRIKEHFGVEK
jgi:hypothetical protein